MSSSELWRKIKKFPNYSVSTFGRVRNDTTAKILKPRDNGNGYLCVNPCDNRQCINQHIHSLVGEAFIDEEHEGLEINHIDGDTKNNYVDNLEYITHHENMQHSYDIGHQTFGMKKVRIIETGEIFESGASLARRLNVSQSNVASVLAGRWNTVRGHHIEFVD